MFFGTPVWPIRWREPYDDAIKKIASAGFKGVELIAWDKKALDDYYTPETIKGLKRLLNDEGLRLINFNHTPENLCSLDNKTRLECKETYKKAVEVAAELGAETFTSVSPYPFSMNEAYERIIRLPLVQRWTIAADLNLDFQKNYDQFAADIKEFSQWNTKAGLKMIIEPHPYRWINSAASMMRLIEHVDEDNLGMNFDPSHLFASGEIPQRTVYEMRGKIWHTHLSDNDTLTNVHWRPGKGKIDWYAVMKALKDTGFNGEISFELEDVPGAATPENESTDEMFKELKLSVNYITSICEDLNISLE